MIDLDGVGDEVVVIVECGGIAGRFDREEGRGGLGDGVGLKLGETTGCEG